MPAVYRNEQISQEFQLLYEGDKLKGLLGFYYLDAQAATSFDVLLGLTGAALPPGVRRAAARPQRLYGGRRADPRPGRCSAISPMISPISSACRSAVATSDNRNAFVYKANRITGLSPEFGGTLTPIAIAVATNFHGERTFKEFTPRASLSFKPNADNMVYASYSKGFKGGGFDPRGSGTSAPISNPVGGPHL